jgi:hypothetical protein
LFARLRVETSGIFKLVLIECFENQWYVYVIETIKNSLRIIEYKLKTYYTIVCHISHRTVVVSSNPAHGEVYPIQHYVIKFVSD